MKLCINYISVRIEQEKLSYEGKTLNYEHLYSPKESTPCWLFEKAGSSSLEREGESDTVTMVLCKSSDYSSLQIGNRPW